MSYKGSIQAVATVQATLQLDSTAEGPAPLTGAFGRSGDGGSVHAGTVVAPGLSDDVEIEVDAKGILRFVVDMSEEGDRGTLTVRVDGVVKTEDPIAGDTTWAYTVRPPG